MRTSFSRKFVKQYEKAPKKIRSAFDKRFKLFLRDPYHSLLNNHSLTGQFKGCRSINITGDWRAIYSEHKPSIAIFEAFGTHSQLYK